MAGKSIKKNYLYNVGYQILTILTPLITTPYLSRVLEPDGIGEVSFVESIAGYFVLFAEFGMFSYGRREISYNQSDREKRSKVFWENKMLELISTSLALIIYVPFAFTRNYSAIYLVYIFNILNVAADITWFFQGMEEFGKIVARNIIFKIINIIYIFVFIKTKSDLIYYALGITLFNFIGNASLWFYLPGYIDKPDISKLKPFSNLKTIVSLFVPSIAIQVYTVLDKTMLGLLTEGSAENGYYEQAMKVSRMTLMIVTALGTVMVPRIGYYYGQGENEKVKNLMYRAYRFVWFLGIPLCLGLIGISKNFVPWFYGDGYEKVIPLLGILGFLILVIGISNVTGIQYLIPTNRQNLLTVTVVIGAVVNLCLNSILIKSFQSIGAAIASVVAETIITLIQLYFVRKEFSLKAIIKSSGHYLIAGVLMLFVLLLIDSYLSPTAFHTMLMIGCGAGVYFMVLVVLRDSFLVENIKSVLAKVTVKR